MENRYYGRIRTLGTYVGIPWPRRTLSFALMGRGLDWGKSRLVTAHSSSLFVSDNPRRTQRGRRMARMVYAEPLECPLCSVLKPREECNKANDAKDAAHWKRQPEKRRSRQA